MRGGVLASYLAGSFKPINLYGLQQKKEEIVAKNTHTEKPSRLYREWVRANNPFGG